MSRIDANSPLNQALALHRAGRFPEAAAAYRTIVKRSPRNAQVLNLLGNALNSMGQHADGRREIEKAIRLMPHVPRFHHDLALTWRNQGEFARAHRALDVAIEKAPDDPGFRATKAELHFMAGDHDAAMAALEPVLDKATQSAAVAIMFATVAPRARRQAEAIGVAERALAQPSLIPAQRKKLLFTLGALFDSIDEHDRAFAAYREGNGLHPAIHDRDHLHRTVDATIANWTAERVAGLPVADDDASRVILVCGMPRSGTTLVERVIAAGDAVHPGGELGTLLRLARELEAGPPIGVPILSSPTVLDRSTVNRAAREYMRTIRDLRVGTRRVVDKMPLNCLNLGLARTILPGARIVHCRRDPMDTCLSCWFQLFEGNLAFAYDLADCGDFYAQYDRLMRHWHEVLDVEILDVEYESLVTDFEPQARRIYAFLDLPWTDDALRFHERGPAALTRSNAQVRQPLYARSVHRHRHYDHHLGPLREALGELAGEQRDGDSGDSGG